MVKDRTGIFSRFRFFHRVNHFCLGKKITKDKIFPDINKNYEAAHDEPINSRIGLFLSSIRTKSLTFNRMYLVGLMMNYKLEGE